MKAAVFRGPNQLKVEDVPYPTLPQGGLILKVEACGVCGSDLRTFEHGMRFAEGSQILGHEIAGQVVEVGQDATDYKVGERLAVAADVHCGHCYYCLRALYNLCESWQLIGTHYPGGFSEYMLLDEAILRRGIVHRTPQGVSGPAAALAEPASSVLASQFNAQVEVGETVVIFGAGPIGCLHVEVTRDRGAKPVVVELSPPRLAVAEGLGLEKALLAGRSDVVAEVRALTGGRGADVAIVAAPSKKAQAQALEVVRKRGRIVFFGGLPQAEQMASLNTNLIHYNELAVIGAFSYHPRFHELALDQIARGKIRAEKIITGLYPLQRIVEAIGAARSGAEVKVVITPNL
jgi:L-iditol 2-dehydrogenase